jgi:hypothetical protein
MMASAMEFRMTPAHTPHPHNRYPDETYLSTAEENDARLQPDPQLSLSAGRASRGQIWMVTLATIAIAGLVLYGITQQPKVSETASVPPPAQTTGAAPSEPPQAEAPASQAVPQEQSAPDQPAKEQAKPGPSDSAR